MKNVFAALLLTVVGFSASARSIIRTTTYTTATINVCPKGAVGCANTINLDGKKYGMAVDENADETAQAINALIGNNQFHNVRVTLPFTATGYFVERGVFPNPTVKRMIFVITEASGMARPRSF